MSTMEEARRAQDRLAKKLMTGFNAAAGLPVNSVGVSKDAGGYFVSVGLERPPTKKEEAQLPASCDGVRVKYTVVGKIVPF